MKPDPSSSSDGKRPLRQPGSSEEKRTADAIEKDLWDLDDLEKPRSPEPVPVEEEAEPTAPAAEGAPASIPVTPRNSRRDMTFKQSPTKTFSPRKKSDSPEGEETEPDLSKRINSLATTGLRPVDDAFDDLESSLATHPDFKETAAPAPVEEPAEEVPAPPPEEAPTIASLKEKVLPTGLSKMERLGLIIFLVLLAATGVFLAAHSLRKLPEEHKHLGSGDFPRKGTRIEAVKIDSYWRAPATTGTTAETFRRGTILLPVVELGVSGGPGAIRIFFRDSDGKTVGDGVTRPVNGESTLTVAATAGFDDAGAFAAYRTGDTKPWFIEVHEGPSVDAPGSAFKKFFEIPISTHRR